MVIPPSIQGNGAIWWLKEGVKGNLGEAYPSLLSAFRRNLKKLTSGDILLR